MCLLGGTATADAAKPRLQRFDDCGQLVRYAKRHMTNYNAGGPPPPFVPFERMPMPTGVPGPAGPGTEGDGPVAAPIPSAGDNAGGDFSLTNNQEAGVFEPDIVKTDGQVVYALSNGTLHVVAARGELREIATLKLADYGYDDQMLLYKDRLLVSGSGLQGGTILRLVDVSDPAKPTLLRTLEVNGALLAQRRTKGTVRVVLNAIPYAIAQPQTSDVDRPQAWVPTGTFKRVATGRTTTRRLVRCKAMRRTKSFTGLESLTVLTIDMEKGLDPVDTDGVMTSGQTVYASASNLYVATHRYEPVIMERTDGPVPPEDTSAIHRFSLDDASNTTYRGSGTVRGYLLNQFAMSEAGDVLRVATTSTPPWFVNDAESESHVITLRAKEDRLDALGSVSGLGKGERIFAVRFVGEVGYVVTFRQVDPLYTVDLSDPANPRVRGELKIPGFSSYLHPIGDGRLIGIGRGPNDAGAQGVQLSLFDVSNLDNPKLEHRTTLIDGSSEAEYDHHAFLWWAPKELAVLPASVYSYSGGPEPMPVPAGDVAFAPGTTFNGAIGFTVRPAGISEAGRITHDGGVVRRSIVMGDRLLTVGDLGLKASTLDGFADIGFVPFAPAGGGGGGGGTVESSPPSAP